MKKMCELKSSFFLVKVFGKKDTRKDVRVQKIENVFDFLMANLSFKFNRKLC